MINQTDNLDEPHDYKTHYPTLPRWEVALDFDSRKDCQVLIKGTWTDAILESSPNDDTDPHERISYWKVRLADGSLLRINHQLSIRAIEF